LNIINNINKLTSDKTIKTTRKVKTSSTKITTLTKAIKTHWSKSVESLILVGKCLHELRKLLERKAYLDHLKVHFAMSEMQAHRIEKLYLYFNTKASVHVLSSKPSVLYLLTSHVDPKKIDSLARGGKVQVGSTSKRLEQLSIKDIPLIGKPSPEIKAFDVDEDELDLKKSQTAHRKLVTLIEELSDWTINLKRLKHQGTEIQNSHLVKKYAMETIGCLEELVQIL